MSTVTQDARPKLEASGYTGAVFGSTFWMLLGSFVFFARPATALGAAWLVGYGISVGWGIWLWRQRARWSRRGLLFRLIGGIAIVSVLLFVAALWAGQGDVLHLTEKDNYSGWLTLLVFPAVAVVLARVHREESGAD